MDKVFITRDSLRLLCREVLGDLPGGVTDPGLALEQLSARLHEHLGAEPEAGVLRSPDVEADRRALIDLVRHHSGEVFAPGTVIDEYLRKAVAAPGLPRPSPTAATAPLRAGAQSSADHEANPVAGKCAWCGGAGRIGSGVGSRCSPCGGKGLVSVGEPPRRCAACGGAGRSAKLKGTACESCGGGGWERAI